MSSRFGTASRLDKNTEFMQKLSSAPIVFTVTFRHYKSEETSKQNWYAHTVFEALRYFRQEHPLAELIKVSRQYL